jgi:hypothetical protein
MVLSFAPVNDAMFTLSAGLSIGLATLPQIPWRVPSKPGTCLPSSERSRRRNCHSSRASCHWQSESWDGPSEKQPFLLENSHFQNDT